MATQSVIRSPSLLAIRSRLLESLRTRSQSTASNAQHISIPKRIPRGPTDILKALAATVPYDPKQPHYKYMDDPYLLPANLADKRSFALSKDSGRKAARFFLDKFPHLFYRDDAEPKIAAFSWPDLVDQTCQVNEEDLKYFISTNQVENARQSFENMINGNVQVSLDTQMSLLELLAFYNGTQVDLSAESKMSLNDRWFKHHDALSAMRNTWKKDEPVLEHLFKALSTGGTDADGGLANPLVYDLMIQATAKYNYAHRANELYKEMAQIKGLVPQTATFDALIRVTPFIRESGEAVLDRIQELMTTMRDCKRVPTVFTFNGALRALSGVLSWRGVRGAANQLMAEMNNLGIEPTIATYAHLTSIFYAARSAPTSILYSIMDRLDGKEVRITHDDDFNFLPRAMEAANLILSDVQLAHRIHAFYSIGNNRLLISDGMSESTYFGHYMKIVAMSEDLTEAMKLYNELVPHAYIPELSVMIAFIDLHHTYDGYDRAQKLWEDLFDFGFSPREKVMSKFMNFLASYQGEDEKLIDQFSDISAHLFGHLKEFDEYQDRNFRNPITWTGEILGYMLKTHIRANKMGRAVRILEFLEQDVSRIIGVPEDQILVDFVEYLLKEKNLKSAYRYLSYCTLYDLPHVLQHVVAHRDHLVPAEFNNALEALIAEAQTDSTRDGDERNERNERNAANEN